MSASAGERTVRQSFPVGCLAVEDAIMIVMDLEMMLKRQGQRVPGAARSVKAGRRLLRTERSDAAVALAEVAEQG